MPQKRLYDEVPPPNSATTIILSRCSPRAHDALLYLVTLVGCLDLLLVRGHEAVSRLRPILGFRIVHLEQKTALIAREVARLGNLVAGTTYLDHVPRLDRDRSVSVPLRAWGRAGGIKGVVGAVLRYSGERKSRLYVFSVIFISTNAKRRFPSHKLYQGSSFEFQTYNSRTASDVVLSPGA